MNKSIIVSMIAAAFIFTGNTVLAADGDIEFTGEIIDQACELANGSEAIKVNLGKVAKTAFQGSGSTAAATKFTLKLINCPATVSSSTVKFDATSYSGNDTIIAIKNESGAATGVGIQLSDTQNSVIPLYTASKSFPLSSTQDNDLDFLARYIAQSDTVTAGPANATATFTINYN